MDHELQAVSLFIELAEARARIAALDLQHRQAREALQTVLDVLIEAENGDYADYADSGRDFGRGVSFLAKTIRERLSNGM